MAKKKTESQSEEKPSFMGQVTGFISELFRFKDAVTEIADQAKEKVLKIIRNIERQLVGGFLMLFGIVFFLISIAFILKDFLKVSFGISFLVIGLILIILGMVYKNHQEI